jgi:hypothetical protein
MNTPSDQNIFGRFILFLYSTSPPPASNLIIIYIRSTFGVAHLPFHAKQVPAIGDSPHATFYSVPLLQGTNMADLRLFGDGNITYTVERMSVVAFTANNVRSFL